MITTATVVNVNVNVIITSNNFINRAAKCFQTCIQMPVEVFLSLHKAQKRQQFYWISIMVYDLI